MFPSGMAANLFDAMRGFAGPMAAFGDALAQPPTQNTQPQQPQNTPPASERAIASLPMVKITIDDLQEESNKECLICLEEQKLGTFSSLDYRPFNSPHLGSFLSDIFEWIALRCT